jgi:hypothetical protein
MLKKIKKFYFKLLGEKGIKLILYLLIFLLLFFPFKQVRAVFGIGDVGVFDLAEVQLDALDFVDSTVLRLILFLALLLFESQVFLYLSANLLQWAINFPINLHNDLVLSGWHFVMGLTNLFLILIFVVIAIAYILKIETFQAKKALPRLIIVALLLNFTLVFIGVFVDIAQITLKSIINALGSDLPTLAIAPLTSNIWNLVIGYLAVLGVYAAASLIPYANVASAFAILIAVIAEAFLGTFSLSILLIILGFGLGIMFFTYFIIFLLRIGIIWILSILSPLAFLCMILPQTRKYWDEWLRTLIEWLTFGIFILLLAGLGLKLFASATVVPGTGPISIGGFGLFPAFTFNYLFLLIYLGVIIYLGKKYTPQMATVLMNQAQALGRGAQRLATTETLRRDLWGPAAEKVAKGFAGAAKLSEKLEAKTKGTAWAPLAKPFVWTSRGLVEPFFKVTAPAIVPPLVEYAAKQRRVTLPAGWKQMSITEKEMYVNSLRRDSDKVVLASEMKGEKTYQKTSKDFRKIIREARNRLVEDPRYKKEVGDLFDAEPEEITKELKIKFELSTIPEAEKAQEKAKIERKIQDIVKEFNLTGPEAENEAARILHTRDLKPEDIAEVSKGSLKTKTFKLAMRRMSSSHLQKLRDSFDEDTVHEVLEGPDGLNTLDVKEIQKLRDPSNPYNNVRLVRWSENTPAGREMLNWAEKLKGQQPSAPPPSTPPTTPPTPPTPPTPAPTPPSAPGIQRKSGYRGQKRDSGGGGNP